MELWLSSIRLNVRDRMVQPALGDAHALHRLVQRGFDAPRHAAGVLHRYVPPGLGLDARLLVQSVAKPDWSFLPRSCGDEPVKDISPFWASLTDGQRVRFRLTASPESPCSRVPGAQRGRRAVIDPEGRLRWLADRFAGAAHVDDVTVTEEAPVSGMRGDVRLGFVSVAFGGTLTIANADAFRRLGTVGVGPRKAFGMGLLLIQKSVTGG